MIVIASGKMRSPSRSFRKLVPRAIDGPEIAPSRCEMKPRATRGSNTTGQRQVGIFFAPKPLDRALAGALADFGRVAQIGGVDRAREIVVALHAGARAGNDAGADPLARPRIKAGKAVGGGKCNARSAPSGLGAFGIGDARDGERRFLGGARPLDQDLGAGLLRVEHVEARPVAGDLGGVGDAAIGVLGDRAGHRDRALDELVERLRRAVAGGHHRLLPPDKHPEP